MKLSTAILRNGAKITGNSKNISKSLAMHHQKYLCYKLAISLYQQLLSAQVKVYKFKIMKHVTLITTLSDLDTMPYKDLLAKTCQGISEKAIYKYLSSINC